MTGGQAADAGGEKGNWEREEMEGKRSLNHFVSFDFDEFVADLPLH